MEEAENQYKLALEADPNDAATHSNYGILLDDLGRMEEAENQYKLALEADPNHAGIHSNYGILLDDLGRMEEAENQYKLALEADPNHAATHSNYGILLKNIGRMEEAENQYKLALEADPNHAATHSNYGILLDDLGRMEEAENQYKLALEADPNDAATHSNYGILLKNIGRMEEAENQYKLALEADPNHAATHSNYGILLDDLGRMEEAENQYKLAIKLDPKCPNSHGAYSLLLISMGLENEEDAIEEMMTASRLFEKEGDRIKEHLVLAWLYEELASKYYVLKKYQDSGQYAELSGNKYIDASEQAGEKFKDTFLTKGYTLKGRAKIRTLHLQPTGNVEIDVEYFEKIMNGIYAASKCYKKAADASPKDNQMCNACSISMRCLSEILNYMLAVTKQEEVPKLKGKIEEWKGNLVGCENAYEGSDQGKNFIQSLYKMIACIESFEESKQFKTWEEKRNLKECIDDLIEIAKNIEGPLQRVIEDVTKQINCYKIETLYTATETKHFFKKNTLQEFKSKDPVVQEIDSTCTPKHKNNHMSLKLFFEHPFIATIVGGIIATIVATIILKRIYPE